MNPMTRFGTVLGLGLTVLAGCSKPEPLPSHRLLIAVTTDDRAAVQGAEIVIGDQVAGQSDAEGELAVVLRRPEGTRLKLQARCPDGYEGGPERHLTLRNLSALGDSPERPLLRERLRCNPTQRDVVIVVSSGGEAEIPITIDGKQYTATNSEGFAHALLTGEPGASFQVALDTAAYPELRPQNPSRSFAISDQDEMVSFVQEFKHERKVSPRRPRKTSGPPRPYRIQ